VKDGDDGVEVRSDGRITMGGGSALRSSLRARGSVGAIAAVGVLPRAMTADARQDGNGDRVSAPLQIAAGAVDGLLRQTGAEDEDEDDAEFSSEHGRGSGLAISDGVGAAVGGMFGALMAFLGGEAENEEPYEHSTTHVNSAEDEETSMDAHGSYGSKASKGETA